MGNAECVEVGCDNAVDGLCCMYVVVIIDNEASCTIPRAFNASKVSILPTNLHTCRRKMLD